MRLIDADSLDTVPWEEKADAVKAIRNAPTIDAVPVIRCKDCVFSKKNYLVNGLCLCERKIYNSSGEVPLNILFGADDFCSDGERETE